MINLINRLLTIPKAATTPQKASKPKINTKNLSIPVSDLAEKESSSRLRKAKLIMVTINDNNRYYDMQENEDDTFTATYGRVGAYGTSRQYPMNLWESKKKEKIRKGYTDTTHLFSTVLSTNDFLEIKNVKVSALVIDLMCFAKQFIYKNYNISSNLMVKCLATDSTSLIVLVSHSTIVHSQVHTGLVADKPKVSSHYMILTSVSN